MVPLQCCDSKTSARTRHRAHLDVVGDGVDDGGLHLHERVGVHGAAVGDQDHAQPVAALLLGRQGLGPRREEDAEGRLALAGEVRQRPALRMLRASHDVLTIAWITLA